MHHITPLRPHVIDCLTGQPLPPEGVQRAVLLPPDHHAERSGDISITEAALMPAPALQPAPAPDQATDPATTLAKPLKPAQKA